MMRLGRGMSPAIGSRIPFLPLLTIVLQKDLGSKASAPLPGKVTMMDQKRGGWVTRDTSWASL